MAYDSDLKRIVMFGGRSAASGPHFSDLWEWDATEGAWNQRTPPGAATALPYDRSRPRDGLRPGDARRRSCSAAGSRAPASSTPNQWEWDGSAQTWTKRQLVAGTQPTPRFGASIVWDSRPQQDAVLFGGFDETTGRRNDIWEMGRRRMTWTDRTPASGTKPSPRHSALMASRLRARQDRALQRQHGHRRRQRRRDRRHLGRRDLGVGRDRGDADRRSPRPAVTSTQYNYGYTSMAYDAGTNKIVLLLLLEPDLDVQPGTTHGAWADGRDAMPTKVDTA